MRLPPTGAAPAGSGRSGIGRRVTGGGAWRRPPEELGGRRRRGAGEAGGEGRGADGHRRRRGTRQPRHCRLRVSSWVMKATAGGFALVLEPTPHTQLQMLNSETKIALDCKCVFGKWVDRGSTRVNDWPKPHCKLASILPVFTGFQSLTPLLRKVRSFTLPGFSVMAAWRCWCASRLARLLANISGVLCSSIGGSSACPPVVSPATSATLGGAGCGLQEGGGRGGRLDILVSVGSAAQSLACGSGGAGGGSGTARRTPFAATRRSFAVRRSAPFAAAAAHRHP